MGLKFDAEQLKKEILNKAFRGELTEQRESDGSGHSLLESIRLERKREEDIGKKSKSELPKIEVNEEPYQLPCNWVWTRLGEVTNYGKTKRWDGDNSVYKYLVDLEDVEKDTSRLIRKREIESVDIYGEKTVFEPGDVVYSKLRPYLNKVFIPDFYGVCSTEMIPIKSKALNNKYLLFLLKSGRYLKYAKGVSFGTKMPRLSTQSVTTYIVPLPPLAEQHRIVEKIEKAFALIDQLDFERIIHDLSDFRKEILNRAFRGELSEQDLADGTGTELLQSIQLERQQQEAESKRKKKTELSPVESGEEPYALPENWAWTRLGEVTNYGQTKRWDGQDSRYNYLIDLEDVEKNTSKLVRKRKVVDLEIKGEKTVFEPGDVVYSKLRPYLNKVFISDFYGVCSTEMIPIKSKAFENSFLMYLLKDNRFLSYADSLSFGTKMPRLSTQSVLTYAVPLPPLAEQHRIVEKIEAIFAQLDVMEDAIRLQKTEASICYEEILKTSLEGTPELVTA